MAVGLRPESSDFERWSEKSMKKEPTRRSTQRLDCVLVAISIVGSAWGSFYVGLKTDTIGY